MESDKNAEIDELMEMVGLEEVKKQVLAINAKVKTCNIQQTSLKRERFNVVFQGNPGTGKTTIARIYAKFLQSSGALSSSHLIETSGATLAYEGPRGTQETIQRLLGMGGGVLFVDEAYQLTAPHASIGGRQVLDIILTEMENHIGKLVVIFVGYNQEMQSFFEHNPGLSSRIPYTMQFTDFDDIELWEILRDNITEKYKGKMKIAEGMDGLYMRVAIRRLARGRGIRGFGNARSVHNLLAKISERRNGQDPDYFYFTKEDLIGPEPSEAMFQSAAWAKLQGLIGLDEVKRSAEAMIGMIETNYKRELAEKNIFNFSLNRVFFGSPGTGKTTVAKLYGKIMADLGLLTNGEVVTKNPSDFIGSCLGKSEAQTRAILAATIGKVLIIDEAYMLNTSATGGNGDSYKTAVIDTLVAEVQSVPGDDRCILILGYEDKLKEMFHNVNPGLSRRFAIDDPFHFQDFDVPQLEQMLKLKMESQDLSATPEALRVAVEMLGRARMRPNFSNGGEVENCLAKAKLNYQIRQSKKKPSERDFDAIFEEEDFDPDFGRTANATTNCRKQLQGIVSEDIIDVLVGYQESGIEAKDNGLDPRGAVPTNFIFKGPSGTGKTTTARHMGKVFYDMGFLSSDEVIECSASDLIGEYVGHTGPKTKKQLERALGKVLFMDEAYLLVEGQYATEAVNELAHLLTQPRYEGKMVVILAGYTPDMNKLLLARPALASLFPDEIIFQNIKPQDCLVLLDRELEQRRISAPFLKNASIPGYRDLLRLIRILSFFPSWSNARDIKTLAKDMSVSALRANGALRGTRPILSKDQAVDCMKRMIEMQYGRSGPGGQNLNRPPKVPEPSILANQPLEQAQAPITTHDSAIDSATNCRPNTDFCAAPDENTPQHAQNTDSTLDHLRAPPTAPRPRALPSAGTTEAEEVDQMQANREAREKEETSLRRIKQKIDDLRASETAQVERAKEAERQAKEAERRSEEAHLETERLQRELESQENELQRSQQEYNERQERESVEAQERERQEREHQEIDEREQQEREQEERVRVREEEEEEERIQQEQNERQEHNKEKKRGRQRFNQLFKGKQKQELKEKPKPMDPCVNGFDWRRDGSGWRCEGGSHFLPD